jgi:uroporphyrinogen-III synthase
MKDSKLRILSTRPLDRALIEKAAYQNIAIDTISYIEIKNHVSPEVQQRVNRLAGEKVTVVFTSMNALDIVVQIVPIQTVMPDWKIYCLGGATFTLVKKYWPYQNVVYTAKNAAELASRIVADQSKEVIFFCGSKRREELPVLLQQNRVFVEELVVYETIETPARVEEKYDAILFFSPSAVHSFFSVNHPTKKVIFFAIGNTTAGAIKQFTDNSIIVSDFPAKDQLVDKALQYFNQRFTNE